jgi:hypothetical protein
MKDNVVPFITSDELAAWRRFLEWASTATETDWLNLYGDEGLELRARLYAIAQERLKQAPK